MMKKRIGAFLAAGVMLLMFASTALATTQSKFDWLGNGYPNTTCSASSATMLWVWTGDSPTSLTINGEAQSGSWAHMGNGAWHFTTTIDAINYPPTTASITYSGDVGVLTLSHCDGTTTTTTTSSTTQSETTGTTTAETTTVTTTTAQSETTGTTTSTTTAQSETTGTTTDGTTTTGSTTSGTTTTGSTTSGTTTAQSETTGTTTGGTTTTSSTTKSGSVEGETGSPTVTPPSTDTLGASSSRTASGAWSVVLALGVVLSLSILVLTPMAKSRRRK